MWLISDVFMRMFSQELLNALPCMQKGTPTWAELRQFGVGWWLRNINTLQKCAEKVQISLKMSIFYIIVDVMQLILRFSNFRKIRD